MHGLLGAGSALGILSHNESNSVADRRRLVTLGKVADMEENP